MVWFQKALSVFLIYKCVVYISQFNALFSGEALIYNKPANIGIINNFAYWLTNHFSVYSSIAFIGVIFMLSILALFNYTSFVSRFICWLVLININNYAYSTLTAGDNLLNQLLFFNIFFSSKKHVHLFFNDLSTALYNMALWGIKIQICLLYVLAALFKLQNTDWLHGTAISQIVQIPEYSNPLLLMLPNTVCVMLTYSTILYQLTFPITVFIRPLKKYVLTFGILQHLFIALAMGLFSFGIVMILSYILFLKYDDKRKIPKKEFENF